MKLKLLGVLAGLLLATSAHALTLITYTFVFRDLAFIPSGPPLDEFRITLIYPEFVTTTGMAPAPGAPLDTFLGYSVGFAGTNSHGWWAFAEDPFAFITDSEVACPFGHCFVFEPDNPDATYFTAPTLTSGTVEGVDATGFRFRGVVDLSITALIIDVPEPATLPLLGLGLVGLGFVGRKRGRFQRLTTRAPLRRGFSFWRCDCAMLVTTTIY